MLRLSNGGSHKVLCPEESPLLFDGCLQPSARHLTAWRGTNGGHLLLPCRRHVHRQRDCLIGHGPDALHPQPFGDAARHSHGVQRGHAVARRKARSRATDCHVIGWPDRPSGPKVSITCG